MDSLARLAGDFWAGAWMDEVDGTTMVVGVTSGDAAKAVALAAPDWVVVKRVDRTIVELGELQDELRTVLFEAVAKRVQELPEDQASIERAGNPANQWYAKVDVVNNRIVVALREGSLLAEEAGRLAPFDQPAVDLRVVQTELGTTESTCPADNCWMLGSGAFLEGNGVCTAGFTYWRGGVPWSSTAEHCGGPYQHSGVAVGATGQAVNNANVDAELITINSQDLWKATNVAYRTWWLQTPIRNKVFNPANGGVINVTVCHSGWGLQTRLAMPESCGPVTSIDGQSGTWPFLGWDNQGVANFENCRGDSGGGVYQPAGTRAFGQIRGWVGPGRVFVDGLNRCADIGNGAESMFSWVNNIEAALGATLRITSVDLPDRTVRTGNGKCLDVRGPSNINGVAMQQWDCVGPSPANQVFDLIPSANSFPLDGNVYTVRANFPFKCVDIAGPSVANGALAQGWDCLNVNNQKFKVQHSVDGYRLVSLHSNRCLDVPFNSASNGVQLHQWDCNSMIAQQFRFPRA